MPTKYVADCSKMPSARNCDLKISGSDREAVADAAYHHAISPVHRHSPDEPGLKEKVYGQLTMEED